MNAIRIAQFAVIVCSLEPACFAQSVASPMSNAGPLLDEAVHQAVDTDLIPGGVLIVGHKGQVVYRKAYGSRALIPHKEPMTLDTIFDAASLTKVVATTPSLMKLFRGRQAAS